MRWLALFGLAGCAQLFGIDSTTGSTDAPPMTPQVTAEVQRVSIGATVLTAPEDLTAGSDTLQFLLPDATAAGGFSRAAATQGPTGTWSAPIATGNPLVDFTLDGQRHIWAFPTRDDKIADLRLEHQHPTPIDPTSTIDLSIAVADAVTTGAFELVEVGPWLSSPVTASSPISQVITTSTMASASGAPAAGLIPTDVVLVLRSDGTQLTGDFEVGSITQMAGATSVSGTMNAVTADQTFGPTVDPTAQATRFAAVRPAVGTPSFSWQVIAAPGAMRGVTSGPQLATGAVASTDTAIAASFGNPFSSLGWPALFDYQASESRTVTVNGLTIELATTSRSLVLADGTMPTLDLPAALAQTISIDQQPLSTDNSTVMIDPAAAATIALVVDRPASILYTVTLFEVVPNDMTTAKLSYVLDLDTNDPAGLAIPSDALVAGHQYTLRVTCFAAGYPGAATGDLQSVSLPIHSATTFSGVFTVSNP
jgi:hypothetical protein